MNKRVIFSLGLAALLSSSLLAENMSCDKEGRGLHKSHDMSHKKHRGGHFMPMVMKLDLSDEQRDKISAIMQERMKNMPDMSDAFTQDGFNKELFIKLQNEKKEQRMQRKAQMIESVYAVLTPVQKKELKKMMDERAAAKKEFFKSCKNAQRS